MNISVELKNTMSPKMKETNKKLQGPSKLALKTYFRKSSMFDQKSSPKINNSIIQVESSSETDSLLSDKNLAIFNKTPIIISSDSEEDDDDFFKSDFLPIKKFKEVTKWVKNIESKTLNRTEFTEFSTIYGDTLKENGDKVAFSSTHTDECSKRFDELFKNKTDLKDKEEEELNDVDLRKFNESISDDNSISNSSISDKSLRLRLTEINEDSFRKSNVQSENEIIDDSFVKEDKALKEQNPPCSDDGSPWSSSSDDKLSGKLLGKDNCTIIEDSFEYDDLNESLGTRLKKKQINDKENESTPAKIVENVLDDVYGTTWRAAKDQVLTRTEPKRKKPLLFNTPKSERKKPAKKDNSLDLLRNLHTQRLETNLDTPLMRIKRICDPDTESEDDSNEPRNFKQKLVFDDEKENEENKFKPSLVDTKGRKIKKNNTNRGKNTNANGKLRYSDSDSDNGAVNKIEKTYTFLESLSANVPLTKCHKSARIYRTDYKQNKNELAKKLFNLYNEKIFNNQIPKDTPLIWNDRMRGSAGFCYCKKTFYRNGNIERTISKICLSTKVLDSPDRLRDTLVHEMCHAATWMVNNINDGHGYYWKCWANKSMEIFPELPQIKRCHDYEINTKYTYKCINCGYCVGRHTKSLDIEQKRCGYCFGKFEILINKITKNGEKKTIPATPKKGPTKFAQFVKENYANLKQPNLKHADVMKLLSLKFSQAKISTV